MARFVLQGIDYDQTGFGELHAVPELQRQLPLTATINRSIPGSDRDDYLLALLDQPIKYHPAEHFDWSRCQSKFIATDTDGQFLWIYAVIIASLFAGTQVHAGMRAFAVRVAYVIDNTTGLDHELSFDKLDSIGWGFISDADEPAETTEPVLPR